MASIGTCRLCKRTVALLKSHIVPRFVYDWMKRTSSTGFLRFGQQPNRRQQDGMKTHLLCAECEARFNAWETPFATRLFLPYHEQGQTILSYDEWLLKFCASVSWRVLTYLRENGYTREMESESGRDIDAALAAWTKFLLDQRPDVGTFEQHLMPVGAIADVDGRLPDNVQRYLMRATEIDRIWNQQSALVFAKLGRFMLIGFIREPEAALWRGTKVEQGSGTLAPSKLYVPDWLAQHLFVDRPKRLAERQSLLSARQKEVIDRTQLANPERVLSSETLVAAMQDLRLRGQRQCQ